MHMVGFMFFVIFSPASFSLEMRVCVSIYKYIIWGKGGVILLSLFSQRTSWNLLFLPLPVP